MASDLNTFITEALIFSAVNFEQHTNAASGFGVGWGMLIVHRCGALVSQEFIGERNSVSRMGWQTDDGTFTFKSWHKP